MTIWKIKGHIFTTSKYDHLIWVQWLVENLSLLGDTDDEKKN